MNIKLNVRPINLACAIFIFDCAVMPVIKLMGLSIKISYGIAFISILLLLFNFIYKRKLTYGSSNSIFIWLMTYTLLLFFGELWSASVYGIAIRTGFFKIIIGVVLMIGSLYCGYASKAKIGAIAYWSFIANVVVNCTLALLGRSVPSFMARLYSVSLDTFIDGYYRNGGIIGNPNSSLLVTNMILLLVVVLYRYDKLRLSSIKLASLYLFSIAADIIVSSRGELLHTVFILAYLTFWIFKKNDSPTKLLKKSIPIVLIILLTVGLLWGVLAERFPNIQTSLDRMTSLDDVFDTSTEDANTASIARPFLKFDVFFGRFKYSPIWGTGIDGGGNISAFTKGTTGYHNDFFMILGATGIIGLILWIKIIKKAITKIGICMISPFIVTAISNTFIQSYFGTMLYFFIIGYVLCFKDKEAKEVCITRRSMSKTSNKL